MMHQEIIIAGFGGQGVLSAGMMLAYAGMLENRNVSWLPSYGAEMRGGTANVNVIVSDEPVASPVLNQATSLIVMNSPSLEKFESWLLPQGLVLMDSDLVDILPKREDVSAFSIPAARISSEMGQPAFANIILLGKLISLTKLVTTDSFEKALRNVLPERKHHLIPGEMKALQIGAEYK